MKLSIPLHILYQVFKTYCSSIALFKYDFRTILWQSSQKTFNREGTSGVYYLFGPAVYEIYMTFTLLTPSLF
jgi:hypothetical protein